MKAEPATFINAFMILYIYIYIYINKCGDWRRQWPKGNVNTEQRDEIGLAVQSWL